MAKFIDWCKRMDGRVELICSCGVGHPSSKLQKRVWEDIDGIHGCCGCCLDRKSFEEYETLLLEKKEK